MTGQIIEYELGDVELISGEILRSAVLVAGTWGQLAPARDNVIVLPTYYTGTHEGYEPLVGPGRVFDTDRYFVVSPNLFGNGVSTSPSNAVEANAGSRFPQIDVYDNVLCQHRLLTEKFDVSSIPLVAGWSMGAIQAFHWAVAFPDMVQRILPWCGSARCSVHNQVFLAGVEAALTADPVYAEGHYDVPPVTGLRAFGRVYCGWAYSQSFFRDGLWSELGFETLEDLLSFWEEDHLAWDANNLLVKLRTWQGADVGKWRHTGGGFEQALASIKARAIVMPSRTDLYFPPEDSAVEVRHMPNAELRVIESVWGHCAGGPGREASAMTQLQAAVEDLLAS